MKIHQLLKFTPILKEKIWGGEKLITELNKKSTSKNLGESWEISDVNNNVSIVSNGGLYGKTLKELISIYQEELVGKKVYERFGEKFPLLIKFIDAKKPLSIQLHPNDKLAKKRHNSFGKTEMWYVMQADKDASLIVGFQKNISAKEYLQHIKNKSLLSILNIDIVQEGDVYFIPSGRIHAIGSGVMLAEIQQTSDITYRVFDWERKDDEGNYRELHTKEAIDAIDYKVQKSYKTYYRKEKNISNTIVSCPYFITSVLHVNGKIDMNHRNKDSFVIYMCVKGSVYITYQNQQEKIIMGETILVPACCKKIKIEAAKPSDLLEIYIP